MTASTADKTVVPLNENRADDEDAVKNSADLSQRMASVQELLFGDAQREMIDRLDHVDDRHRDFASTTNAQIQMMTEMFEKKIEVLREEIRSIDRAQTAKRRKMIGDLGDTIKSLAYDA